MSTCRKAENNVLALSLRMLIKIGGQTYQALIDTGSTVSLIESSVVTGNLRRNDNVTLRTAGNSQGLTSTFKVNQDFEINSKTYQHEFLVVESLNLPPLSIILGFDLISRLKFVIKAQDRTEIFLDGQLIPSFQCPSLTVNVVQSEKEVSIFALVPEELTVPKSSALCLKLKVVGKKFT